MTLSLRRSAHIMTDRAVERAVERRAAAHITGPRIQTMRLARGVTQQQIAEAIGMSVGTVYNIEQGKRLVRPHELLAIARLLRVDAGFLRGDHDRLALVATKVPDAMAALEATLDEVAA